VPAQPTRPRLAQLIVIENIQVYYPMERPTYRYIQTRSHQKIGNLSLVSTRDYYPQPRALSLLTIAFRERA
jgi:hypothetical protein